MAKILGVVITYYPVVDELEHNIASYIDDIGSLVIWENTPMPEAMQYRTINNEKIIYLGEGRNVGIAHALNKVLSFALHKGYDYMLIMDQDSYFDNFAEYKKLVLSHSSFNNGVVYNPIRELKSPMSQIQNDEDKFIESYDLINSGSIVDALSICELGGWDEDFFVDGVDESLMCRLRCNNIKAYFVNCEGFQHHLGYPVVKKFFGKSYSFSNYSSKRLYDRYRSIFLLKKKYPQFKDLHRRLFYDWFRIYPIRLLIGGRQRFSKFFSIFKGCLKGMFYKKGNI